MVWTITSLLELSKTVEDKGGLNNCLRSVETKANVRVIGLHLRGLRKETARGCMELRESERRKVLSKSEEPEDGLGEFYD